MFVVLIRKMIEGAEVVEQGPTWIEDSLVEYLSTPEDDAETEYFWKTFEDRKHVIEAGY